ncbi:hypothetical protein QFC20_006144 [Naganishia adeliensis]|uniref:Uncharacterized protein n=1 Tax=Naganishia adeliensis TaxID=92952 RepID=A0ACC2VDU4_9TREE|nr:hypothetical protein QFC20_006144 [Naganishia adeliensis]
MLGRALLLSAPGFIATKSSWRKIVDTTAYAPYGHHERVSRYSASLMARLSYSALVRWSDSSGGDGNQRRAQGPFPGQDGDAIRCFGTFKVAVVEQGPQCVAFALSPSRAYVLRLARSPSDHPADPSPDLPPLEPEQPTLEPIEEPSTTTAPQDMTYCTAPDTTATEADITIQAPTSGRGRGIPRGRTTTSARGRAPVGAGTTTAVPGGKKAPANAIERRKREAAVNAIVDTLPIEYRGSDPIARQMMERVLGHLLDNPQGQRMAEIVKPLGLPQAKVNKCLIALVGKKAVTKTAVGGVAVYALV